MYRPKKPILIFCFLLPLLFAQCSKIDFIYKFGPSDADVKNQLRTSENVFIKDMVVDSPLVIKLKLTWKEKKIILNKVNEIDFWSYPEKFYYEAAQKDSLVMSGPCMNYYLQVFYCKKQKQVRWNYCWVGKTFRGIEA
jgi:hypothetical protein